MFPFGGEGIEDDDALAGLSEVDSEPDTTDNAVWEAQGHGGRGKGSSKGSGSSKGGPGNASGAILMCLICGLNPRNNKQWFCSSPCGGDVRAAERDAKCQGKDAHDAFKKLRKKGGAEFVTTVNVHKAKCSGFGRGFKRPAFQGVRYYMAIVYSSVLQTGSKMLWLTKAGCCKHKEQMEGLTLEQANLEWERQLDSAPKSRISQDRTKLDAS